MKPAEFVARLQALPFKSDADNLEEAEDRYRETMASYRGYDALSVAFTRLFLETIPAFNKEVVPKVTKPVTVQHGLFIERLVHAFLTLRAARIAAHSGYPLQGFTLLRNVYDDCVLASAVLQGLTDFEELAGVKDGEDFNDDRMRKNRVAVERRVRPKMDGAESGLSSDIKEHLKTMDRMYDAETHGGRMTTAYNQAWVLGTAPLAVVPNFREDVASLYINRYLETAWMVHRLLPHVQLPDALLSNDWASKWQVVDGAFHHVVMSLFHSDGKAFFKAMCEFVAAKFPFNAASRFPI